MIGYEWDSKDWRVIYLRILGSGMPAQQALENYIERRDRAKNHKEYMERLHERLNANV